MARGMALAGVDPSELAPPPPPKQPKTFSEKLSNFWYHYKTHTIAGIVLLLLLGWVLFETFGTNPPDYHVVVVTELPLLSEETDQLKQYMAAHGEDFDGDGAVEIEIESLIPSYYDEHAPTVGRADNDKLMAHLTTGERMLFVFDRVSYDGFMDKVDSVTEENFEFLAELPVTSPDYDPEERVWTWANDPARTLFSALDALPNDMLFCVRNPVGTASGEQSVKDHKNGEALLVKLIEAAESYTASAE